MGNRVDAGIGIGIDRVTVMAAAPVLANGVGVVREERATAELSSRRTVGVEEVVGQAWRNAAVNPACSKDIGIGTYMDWPSGCS